jgi:hypothetical protein
LYKNWLGKTSNGDELDEQKTNSNPYRDFDFSFLRVGLGKSHWKSQSMEKTMVNSNNGKNGKDSLVH